MSMSLVTGSYADAVGIITIRYDFGAELYLGNGLENRRPQGLGGLLQMSCSLMANGTADPH